MGPSVRDGRAERTERWLIAAGPDTLYICTVSPLHGQWPGLRRYLETTDHRARSTELTSRFQPASSI